MSLTKETKCESSYKKLTGDKDTFKSDIYFRCFNSVTFNKEVDYYISYDRGHQFNMIVPKHRFLDLIKFLQEVAREEGLIELNDKEFDLKA